MERLPWESKCHIIVHTNAGKNGTFSGLNQSVLIIQGRQGLSLSLSLENARPSKFTMRGIQMHLRTNSIAMPPYQSLEFTTPTPLIMHLKGNSDHNHPLVSNIYLATSY